MFANAFFSGDGAYMDMDGYVFITGRVDDIINVNKGSSVYVIG